MKHHRTLEHSPFDAMILALDAETSALGTATLALGAATSAPSFQRHRHRVSAVIGDCGVGITPQICNRVTNRADMSTFYKQASKCLFLTYECLFLMSESLFLTSECLFLTSKSPFIWVYNQTLPTKPNLSKRIFPMSECLLPTRR